VQAIYDNCRGLLRSQHQRAGMELMEQMVRLREAAYERLCRWVGERGLVGGGDRMLVVVGLHHIAFIQRTGMCSQSCKLTSAGVIHTTQMSYPNASHIPTSQLKA
jgi:hypothetical protein